MEDKRGKGGSRLTHSYIPSSFFRSSGDWRYSPDQSESDTRGKVVSS